MDELTWESLYNNPEARDSNPQTVTLYATSFHPCQAPENNPLTYRGTRYDSLAQLVQTIGPDDMGKPGTYPLWSGPNLLMLSVAPTGQGTGLGLAIVRHILQLHGETCTAQTTNTGVAFTVTL